MLRKLWPLLLILTSSGCKGTLPIRPHLDACMVSAPDPSSEDPSPFQGCICSDGDKVWRLTFKECDKYNAFNPAQLSQFAEYVLKLEQMAQKQCGLRSAPASDAINEMFDGLETAGAMR